jgi:hypothetical protein
MFHQHWEQYVCQPERRSMVGHYCGFILFWEVRIEELMLYCIGGLLSVKMYDSLEVSW